MFKILLGLFIFINNVYAVNCFTNIQGAVKISGPRHVGGMFAIGAKNDMELFPHSCYWPTGKRIRIRFLNGNSYDQSVVQSYAMEWTKYANLQFMFVDSGDAEIRIQLTNENPTGENRSQIGICSNNQNQAMHTMTLHNIDRATVLHEFGHAIGLMHEHQHPNLDIQWNKPAVYDYYGRHGWSKEETDLNVFDKIISTSFSHPDINSIMMYYIPASHTLNGFSTVGGQDLSEQDKSFIGKIYSRNDYIVRDGEKVTVYGYWGSDELGPGFGCGGIVPHEKEVYVEKVKPKLPDIPFFAPINQANNFRDSLVFSLK